MKIMAIDFGDKRTGLACCDETETLAFPVETIIETNIKALINKIVKKITQLKVKLIVIGNPVNMNGSLGPRSKICAKFKEKLQKATNLPTILWDERQTTLLAQRFMIDSKTKKSKKKNLIDQVAATIILENYLKFKKNTEKL